MKTFVTGATGLLGNNLVQALVADGHTVGTIGFGPDGRAGDENMPPHPITGENLYFKSKLLAAARLREFAARTRFDVVEVLPGWMFGPWEAAPTGSGRFVLDFLASWPGTSSRSAMWPSAWRGSPVCPPRGAGSRIQSP